MNNEKPRNAPKVICRLESINDAPVVEIGRAAGNFYRRALLPDGTPAASPQSNWRQLTASEIGNIVTGIDSLVKAAIVASLHAQQQRKKVETPRKRLDNPSPATLAQRERRERLKTQSAVPSKDEK